MSMMRVFTDIRNENTTTKVSSGPKFNALCQYIVGIG